MKKVEVEILKEYESSPHLSLAGAARAVGQGRIVGAGYVLPEGLYCRYITDPEEFIEVQGMLARYGALEVFYWVKEAK